MLLTLLLPLAASADESGTCGDNLTWTYEESTKTLTISGEGKMQDYYQGFSPFWLDRLGFIIEKVIIEEGVSSIGSFAFYQCYSLASVTIPNSVASIGTGAFSGCI